MRARANCKPATDGGQAAKPLISNVTASVYLVVELAHDQVVGVPLDCVVCFVEDQEVDLAHLHTQAADEGDQGQC